jgi:hypothetical protein
MPTIETSKDILFYALAISAIGISFFLCWSLFYLTMTLKDARSVTKDIKLKIESFWETIELLKEKLQFGGAAFSLAAKGIKELSDFLKANNKEKSKKK